MTTQMIPLSNLFESVFAPTACSVRQPQNAAALSPRTDIFEGEQEFHLRMDLPGIERNDLSIEIDGETLTIQAERKESIDDTFRPLRRERNNNLRLKRSFELGRRVNRETIAATLTDGVLTVVLPKSEQAVTRRIEIR